MNKPAQLVLNVIVLVIMLTHGVHAGVEDQNGRSPVIPASPVALNDGPVTVGETWPLENEAAAMMLSVCGGAETAVPAPPASPDGPSALTLPQAPTALSALIPLIAVHEPPTCPPDVKRAFLQVFRN